MTELFGSRIPRNPELIAVVWPIGEAPVPNRAGRQAAAAMLREYGFAVQQRPESSMLDLESELQEIDTGESFPAEAGQADLLVVVGSQGIGLADDAAERVRSCLDNERIGLAQQMRAAQVEAGYLRSMFEDPAAGWLGETLVLTLPDDLDAVQSSIQEVGAIVSEVLHELSAERRAANRARLSSREAELGSNVVPLKRAFAADADSADDSADDSEDPGTS